MKRTAYSSKIVLYDMLLQDPEFADIRRELLLATDSGSVETLSHWIDQFVDKDMNDLGELVKAKKKLQVARLNRGRRLKVQQI